MKKSQVRSHRVSRSRPLMALVCAGLTFAASSGVATAAALPKSSHPPVTLVVEDGWVGTPGRIPTLQTAAKQFEATHKGVKIEIKSQTFAQLQATGVLELSGSTPPSVFAVNQGYGSLGQLVKEKLLTPLGGYAAKYGWDKLQSPTLLAIDGRQSPTAIGAGPLYGVSVTGDWVGIYYNKSLLKKIGQPVPATYSAFTHDLALAKSAGIIPMATGSGSGNDLLLHLWWLEMLAQTKSMSSVRDLVDGVGNHSWHSAAVIDSARTLLQWGHDGYLSPGYSGLSLTEAVAQFATGKALFLAAGSWITPSLTSMAGKVGMIPIPSATSSHGPESVATGGQVLVIPRKALHHALAAEFLNYLLSRKVAKLYLRDNQLPATTVPGEASVATGLTRVVAEGWLKAAEGTASMPYPDWATPNFFNLLMSLVPELTAGKISPSQFGSQLQSSYIQFRSTLR